MPDQSNDQTKSNMNAMADKSKAMTDDAANKTKSMMNDAADKTKAMTDQAADNTRAMTDASTRAMTDASSKAQEMGRNVMEKSMAGMAEFTRMFQDMKMPMMGGGMETFMAAQRKNMEVLSAANRVALEGAQAVATRHMEIMQQTMSEMSESLRDMASPESPQARAAKQAEMLKTAYERAVAHIKELADLIQRSNGEALSMLNTRFTEALDEVKQLAAKQG